MNSKLLAPLSRRVWVVFGALAIALVGGSTVAYASTSGAPLVSTTSLQLLAPIAPPGGTNLRLRGFACLATNDCFAVGSYKSGGASAP